MHRVTLRFQGATTVNEQIDDLVEILARLLAGQAPAQRDVYIERLRALLAQEDQRRAAEGRQQ